MSTRPILWRVALSSSSDRVYDALATNEGRRVFWARAADERDGAICFLFPNGAREESRILAADRPRRFCIEYFGARTCFDIAPNGAGAVLTLTAEGVPDSEWHEVHAGWVSVLLIMKAAIDFGIDLRNGDGTRTWDQGFVDQ